MIDAPALRVQMDFAFRIRRAICVISEKQPTYARCVIDQYLQHIAPSMALARGADFPVSYRPHVNVERAASHTGKYPALYFHIGSAIKGFYEVAYGRECPALEARVALLESIAQYGMDIHTVEGDDMTGYALTSRIPPAPQPEFEYDAIPDTASSTIGLHESGGRTRLRRSEAVVLRAEQGDGT